MFKNTKAVAITAVAGLAVLGGTLAAFTDSDTTEQQVLKAGTVEVDIAEDADWTQALDNLAIGDTEVRGITLENSSTLEIKGIRLTSNAVNTNGELGGELSEAVAVTIKQDGVALAENVRVKDLAAGYDLKFTGGLAAGTDVELDFEYKVVGARETETGDRTKGAREGTANPDNKYQGSAFAVTYTIDAIQRDGNTAP